MAPQYRDNPNLNVHQFEDPNDGGYDSYEESGGRRGNASFHNSSFNQSSSRIHPVLPVQPGANGTHDTNFDFDAFSSDAEKLSAILKCADTEQHKHALSVQYYSFRKYALLIPILVMSLLIAIGGFIAASDIMHDNMRVHDSTMQEFLTLLVATFGFMVLILTILGNGLDYNSKVRFHCAAAEDLNGLCDKVRLYRMERAMDERAKEEDEELKDLFEEDDGNDSTESDSSSDDDDVDDDVTPQAAAGTALIPHIGDALEVKRVKRQIKHNKKMQRRHERLTKTLVKQKVREARHEQELSKDVITFYGYHAELHQISHGCRAMYPLPFLSSSTSWKAGWSS